MLSTISTEEVEVSCENNPQLMIYAYGSMRMFEALYDTVDINMVIIQPRLNNISEWSCTKDELVDWAVNEVKPKTALAYEGKGEFKCIRGVSFVRHDETVDIEQKRCLKSKAIVLKIKHY